MDYFQMLGQKLKHGYINLQLNYMCILETYEEYSLCLPERKKMYIMFLKYVFKNEII